MENLIGLPQRQVTDPLAAYWCLYIQANLWRVNQNTAVFYRPAPRFRRGLSGFEHVISDFFSHHNGRRIGVAAD